MGGYENIGCTKKDLENYQQAVRFTIESSDAQMFVDYLKNKKLSNPSFFYECELDEKDLLVHVFWADGTCRKDYALFGDVVSFDSTYNTNQYKMIFTPFIGVNHHMGMVTFGAAFLANETIVSYKWLFQTFMKAMGGKEPTLIITDEDSSMRVAINNVFTNTKHRLCMWHILKKVPEKVGALNINPYFNKRLSDCVWNSDSPEVFEKVWSSIINDFGLHENEWLKKKYEMRDEWIPAFFKDLYLGGILRTTSRSESANSYFKHFVCKRLSLVEFWFKFDSALDAQRYQQLVTDHDSLHKMPQLKSCWNMEKHARDMFTHKVFCIFQNELVAARDECVVKSITNLGEITVQGILEKNT